MKLEGFPTHKSSMPVYLNKEEEMKNVLKLFLLLLLLPGLSACGGDDNDSAVSTDLSQNLRGTFTDVRDGNEYHYVRIGNLDWMTENSRYDTGDDGTRTVYATMQIPGDYGMTTDAQTIARYGYLYTYEGAQQAAPDGWRIPTDEDWKTLEKALGMSNKAADALEWRGNGQGVILHDASGLNMPYAGFYDAESTSFSSKYYYINAMGYYWSSTSPSEGLGFMRKIIYNSNQVYRYTTSTKNMLSVRFVRDAQ